MSDHRIRASSGHDTSPAPTATVAARARRGARIAVPSLLAAVGVAACGSSPGPSTTASAFVAALDRQDWAAAAALVSPPAPTLATTYRQARTDLGATSVDVVAGRVVAHGTAASAPLTTTAAVPGYGTLTLQSTLTLQHTGNAWRVVWSPATLAAGLVAGNRFSVASAFGARAPVTGAGGASLTPAGISVGLVGSRIKDVAELTSLLGAAGFAPASIAADEASAMARPTQLVPVGVLPMSTYLTLKGERGTNLYSIGGTAFTTGVQAPLTAQLGDHLVGTVGPVTAEELHALGAPYDATDQVGQGGIEALDERRLAGTPTVTVTVVDAAGHTVRTLGTRAGTPGRAVATTVDPVVEEAAEAAMAGVAPTVQAAMVVERASTGAVLAAVSLPVTAPFQVALDGQVPPGSTFKVVTSTALLQSGATPATAATCPATRTVDGQVFHNFEGEGAATLTLAQAFAVSCNTAFIGLSASLPDAAIPAAAALYGLGTTPRPGVGVAGSSVPTPTSANQLAATSIGQAGVVVSPLAMASVAATVDSGSYHPPRLVVGAPDDTAAATPLPAGTAATLHTLMAGVLQGNGTAAGAGLPAGTYGKTGTAEFGAGPNPPTHAWFIGFRGDLAFSVFVYGGGVGGAVAAPLATKLLDGLPSGYDTTSATP